jgi:uncharacterized phage-associated protein
MNINAIAVANFFIDIAQDEHVNIYQLGLMKRVYITHGFCLALYDQSILDSRYDVVEAWKNGPVIPSVYHSFKYNRDNPITEKAISLEINDESFKFSTPELEDEDIQEVAYAIWKRYLSMSDIDIVKLLHRKGTPWYLCYEEGKNNKIPDSYTRLYYKKQLDYAEKIYEEKHKN